MIASRLLLCAVVSFPLASTASPDSSPDSDASVVFLRTNCDIEGSPKENCFESMASLSDPTTGWIWSTRSPSPSASSPLIVDIGPGEFGSFQCEGGSYVTLRGSGREQTILSDDEYAIEVKNCDQLSFIDLGARGDSAAVFWTGGGFSSWSNTDLVNSGTSDIYARLAWYDTCDVAQIPNVERSTHYFHGSRVRVVGSGTGFTTAFLSQCGETWFFGGEILADFDAANGDTNAFVVSAGQFGLDAIGDVRLFGTTVRGRVVPGSALGLVLGVRASQGGVFHAHGSIVNVSAEGASVNSNVIGLRSTNGSFAHTPGTSWALTPGGSGSVTRVQTSSGGVAHSPFFWQSGSTPPPISSQHGADVFVETDCLSNGDCDSTGGEAHMMVYDATCTSSGPWRDMVTGSCRP